MTQNIDAVNERTTSRIGVLFGGALIAMVLVAGCSTDTDDGSETESGAEAIQSTEVSEDAESEDGQPSRSAGSSDDSEDAESDGDESTLSETESDTESDRESETDETATLDTDTSYGYVSSYAAPQASQLYAYISGDLDLIGNTLDGDTAVQVTDVAAVDSTLYGISFDQLFLINTETAEATAIGGLSGDRFNSLVALSDGQLLAGGLEGTLSIIDPETGSSDQFGRYPAGLVSSGDLVVMPDGAVLGSANDGNNEFLISVDPDTGAADIVVEGLPQQLWGLLLSNEGELLGFTATPVDECIVGEIIEIDVASGSFTSVGCTSFVPGGATNSARLQDSR